MPWFDLPLDQLRTYAPDAKAPQDFDEFWRRTLAEQDERFPLTASFTPYRPELYTAATVADVSYTGFGGQAVRGWLLAPREVKEPLPCLVTFAGYGGGRGLPIEHVAPLANGFVHFVMDTRGQGSVWCKGDTPDDAGPTQHYPGFLTKGIEARETYYYRRVFTDAVRAVQAACQHPAVDPQRIVVSGSSQGGGIALATAGLLGKQIRACLAGVPFLCHFRRAITLTTNTAYAEIASYLRIHSDREEATLRTLSYFDGMFFAERIQVPTLVATGQMDEVCPPSTVFAAYNRITAEKEIIVYPFAAHDGGGAIYAERRLAFALDVLAK